MLQPLAVTQGETSSYIYGIHFAGLALSAPRQLNFAKVAYNAR